MLVQEKDLPVSVSVMVMEALVLVQEKDLLVLVLVPVMFLVVLELVQERDLLELVQVTVLGLELKKGLLDLGKVQGLVMAMDLPEKVLVMVLG